MKSVEIYKQEFLKYLEEHIKVVEPKNLYEPIQYILQIGGKRLRPVLTLLSCDLFDGNSKKAFDAALAIEVFHNFTLIHDDIMDRAAMRRGKKTVHEKWDINTGILSGDAMMIMANQCFEGYEPQLFVALVTLFNKTALEVCEGQQMDMDFELSNEVNIPMYMKMIQNKTSVLVAAAMKLGAMVAKADPKQADVLYDFGLNLGLAFQLQDDYLDTFGDAAVFGKKIGGDIMENKKTFLYLKAMELGSQADQNKLFDLYNDKRDSDTKIQEVTALFNKYELEKHTLATIQEFTKTAFSKLNSLEVSDAKKEYLRQFGIDLMKRTL